MCLLRSVSPFEVIRNGLMRARYWWNRFASMFAAEIRRKRVQQMWSYSNWQWQETGRWLNNRVDNSHLPFRRWERVMQRFRSMRSLQKFATGHVFVCNHFNQERHLYSRDNFKLNRTAALSKWRQLHSV